MQLSWVINPPISHAQNVRVNMNVGSSIAREQIVSVTHQHGAATLKTERFNTFTCKLALRAAP